MFKEKNPDNLWEKVYFLFLQKSELVLLRTESMYLE